MKTPFNHIIFNKSLPLIMGCMVLLLSLIPCQDAPIDIPKTDTINKTEQTTTQNIPDDSPFCVVHGSIVVTQVQTTLDFCMYFVQKDFNSLYIEVKDFLLTHYFWHPPLHK